MKPTVGIPRALLYYEFFPLWNVFLKSLGVSTCVSPCTNKRILANGLKNSVDEACLPIKLAMGHVIELCGKVDYIFLPRIVSVAPREYICPKFLGFPDMVRNAVPNVPKLIDANIDLYHPRSKAQKNLHEIGKLFCSNPMRINRAHKTACHSLISFKKLLQKNILPEEAMEIMACKESAFKNKHCNYDSNGPTIALIGHSYNIYDQHISMDIIGRLKKLGVNVVTAETLPEETIRQGATILPKKLFWTLGQQSIGSAIHFLSDPAISGIILVSSFGCGPDALTGELIERYIHGTRPIPFLKLTLDEHTGEAGVITRLEAFLDMVYWKAG
ncbi:MAG: hypothetical protein FH756_09435 [Firmicutes bacterium]|nr:hypothetical protein [Bacillota bacterium]